MAGAFSLLATACAHDHAPLANLEAAGAGAAADPFFEGDFVEEHGSDPLEPMNRPIFAGNMALDRFLIDPVAHAYGAITPVAVRRAVRSVFANLNAPVVFIVAP